MSKSKKNKTCQSTMAVSAEYTTQEQLIESTFNRKLEEFNDIFDATDETVNELSIHEGTGEMKHLLEYIYKKTGEIVIYFDCHSWSLNGYISYETSNLQDYLYDRLSDASIPEEAIDEEYLTSLEEMILNNAI